MNKDPVTGQFSASISAERCTAILNQLEDIEPAVLKRALIGYFKESEHSGWDCWEKRDVRAIRKWLEDFSFTVALPIDFHGNGEDEK
jgi:hypothetical protein